MRRLAIVSAILGVLIVADGIYQQISQYNGGETQDLLNLHKVMLSDGVTLIISGAIVLVASLVAFFWPARKATAKEQ